MLKQSLVKQKFWSLILENVAPHTQKIHTTLGISSEKTFKSTVMKTKYPKHKINPNIIKDKQIALSKGRKTTINCSKSKFDAP